MNERVLHDALRAMDAEVSRLTRALEIIAGRRPVPDNLMGHADVASAALDKKWPFAFTHHRTDDTGTAR